MRLSRLLLLEARVIGARRACRMGRVSLHVRMLVLRHLLVMVLMLILHLLHVHALLSAYVVWIRRLHLMMRIVWARRWSH